MSFNPILLEQTEARDTVSDRYQVMTTQTVIDNFKRHGFVLQDMQQARVRKPENENKQKHLVRLSRVEDSGYGTRHDVIITNSYNASSSLKLFVGMYRFACMNGLVVGEDILEPIRIMHTKQDWMEDVDAFVAGYVGYKEAVQRSVWQMQHQWLDREAQYNLAKRAIELREPDGNYLDPSQLLLIRRKEDMENDVWTVFNRIQESLINGYYWKEGTQTVDGVIEAKIKEAKVLTNTDSITKVNSKLWNLANELVA